MPDLPKVQSLDDALRWLDRLEQAPSVTSHTAWPSGSQSRMSGGSRNA